MIDKPHDIVFDDDGEDDLPELPFEKAPKLSVRELLVNANCRFDSQEARIAELEAQLGLRLGRSTNARIAELEAQLEVQKARSKELESLLDKQETRIAQLESNTVMFSFEPKCLKTKRWS